MGPLVTAASLQHVAGIENSAMQLVLMRCSLDLTSNYESGLISKNTFHTLTTHPV